MKLKTEFREMEYGIEEISRRYGGKIFNDIESLTVTCAEKTAFRIKNGEVQIQARTLSEAYNALGSVLAKTKRSGQVHGEVRCKVKDLGVMLDCARNAVPNMESLKKFIGPPLQEIVKVLLPDLSADEQAEAIEKFKSIYDYSSHERTAAYKWMTKYLNFLYENNCKLYVVTNKRIYPTKYLVEKYGWGKLFTAIYTPDLHAGKIYKKHERSIFFCPNHFVNISITLYINAIPLKFQVKTDKKHYLKCLKYVK